MLIKTKDWTRWLPAALLAAPLGCHAWQLDLDNQLLRQGRPWPVDQARIRFGHGPWTTLRLQPGHQSVESTGADDDAAEAAVIELQIPGRQWLVSTFPLHRPSRTLTLRGELESLERQGLPGNDGATVDFGRQDMTVDDDTGSGSFRPIDMELLDQASSAKCAFIDLKLPGNTFQCLIDVGGPHSLLLSLYSLNPLRGFAGGYFWGTFTSPVPAERWIQLSQRCDSITFRPCPEFDGWAWFYGLKFDLVDGFDRVHGQLALDGAGLTWGHFNGWAFFGWAPFDWMRAAFDAHPGVVTPPAA